MGDDKPNLVPVVGDCYESSFKNGRELELMKFAVERNEADAKEFAGLYERFGLSNDVVIVHGWVSSPGGPDPKKRFHHAWIEVGDYAFETQGGTRKQVPKKEYYEVFRAFPNQRYSIQDAAALIERDKRFHAWRGKGTDEQC
jgi:hypothetical protein